jgi:hypothetical protein
MKLGNWGGQQIDPPLLLHMFWNWAFSDCHMLLKYAVVSSRWRMMLACPRVMEKASFCTSRLVFILWRKVSLSFLCLWAHFVRLLQECLFHVLGIRWVHQDPKSYNYAFLYQLVLFCRNRPNPSDGFHFCSIFSNQQWYSEPHPISFPR